MVRYVWGWLKFREIITVADILVLSYSIFIINSCYGKSYGFPEADTNPNETRFYEQDLTRLLIDHSAK